MLYRCELVPLSAEDRLYRMLLNSLILHSILSYQQGIKKT